MKSNQVKTALLLSCATTALTMSLFMSDAAQAQRSSGRAHARQHPGLVHAAAGGVGQLLCQVAKIRGARVLGTVSTEEKAALARAAGADEVIRYDQVDFAAEVKRLTGGHGVQVVYDGVGRTTFEWMRMRS